jgi:hypothetical protein
MTAQAPTLEEVLDQMAFEPAVDGPTVRRYIDAFPHFESDILDFALVMMTPDDQTTIPTPAMEAAGDRLLDRLMASHCPLPQQGNPLAALSVASVEQATGIAGPLIDVLRKGLVKVDSIPEVIVRKLVAFLSLTRDQVLAGLAIASGPNPAIEHRSASKPRVGSALPFEHYFENSDLTDEEKRSTLME